MKFGPQKSVAASSTERHWLTHGKTVWLFFYDGAGAIKVQKSLDQGYTFAAAVTIDATAGDNDVMLNEPAAYDEVTGRLHLCYGRNIDSGSNAVLCHKFSDDNGATWSAEHLLDNGAGHGGTNRFYRVGLTARNGVVFCGYTSEDNAVFTTDGLWFVRSADGGATWTAAAKLYTAGIVCPFEPNTSIGADGTVHFTWYDPGSVANLPGPIYYARSSDSGVTWPAAPTQITSDPYGRVRVTTSNGVVLVVGGAGANPALADIGLLRSTDNGATWAAPVIVAVHSTAELSHPWCEIDSQLAAIMWIDRSTAIGTYGLLLSTDAGATWSAGPTPLTRTGGNSDASQLALTDDVLLATGYDSTALTYIWAVYPLLSPAVPSSPVLDTFNRANEDPLSNGGVWSVPGGIAGADNAKLVGNQAVRRNGAGAFDRAGAYLNNAVYTTAAEVYATIASTGAADCEIDVLLLDEPVNKNGYWLKGSAGAFGNGHTLERLTAAAGTTLQSDAVACATGDKDLLRVTPAEVIAYRFDGSDWFELFRAADATYRAGLRAELNIVGNTTGGQAVDDFGGGPLVVPSNTAVPAASGSVGLGRTVTCGLGSWAAAQGATPTRYRYQWQSSPDGTVWTDIAGAKLSLYVVTAGDVGKQLRCNVTAFNSIGSATVASNALTASSGFGGLLGRRRRGGIHVMTGQG